MNKFSHLGRRQPGFLVCRRHAGCHALAWLVIEIGIVSADDPSLRYIQRMRQAIRILYGSASPSEAFQSSSLNPRALDIARFL